ncbi:hypothetical protein [Micromonospora sp. C97]|uniref:hypothetical protein n=1 Tax=Micromonospora sp. C97 TaxID=2824883 RepID=UPI001FFD546C|nr:hypothetical protein [Micromonospora sp. C97]
MVLILESRTHLDLGDLPNLLAAELGVMTVRLERAIRSLDGVARVHVNRWGDGSAHLHMWFLARPYGRLQLRGTFLSLWDSILPPISEAQWRENLALVAAWLAEFGGRPLAEPPRIQWQAPSSLLAQSAAADAAAAAEAASAAAAAADAVSVIEAAEEIPEPVLDSPSGSADADSVPAVGPVPQANAGAGSTATTVADRAAEPARTPPVTNPAGVPAVPARDATAPAGSAASDNAASDRTGSDRTGSDRTASESAAFGSAATVGTPTDKAAATPTDNPAGRPGDGLRVGPAGASADAPDVDPAGARVDESGSAPAIPAASDLANGGASGAAGRTSIPSDPGAAARTNGTDTPDVRAGH